MRVRVCVCVLHGVLFVYKCEYVHVHVDNTHENEDHPTNHIHVPSRHVRVFLSPPMPRSTALV